MKKRLSIRALVRSASAVLVLALVKVVPAPVQAHIGKLRPVDEAVRDPSFYLFRARLLEALVRHDAAALLRAVSQDVRTGFGPEGGKDDFRRRWIPERQGSQIWPTLASVLSLGGAFQGGVFAAPYVYSNFPPAVDAFEYGVILGENVRVRSRASSNAPSIARLSYDVVRVTDWDFDRGHTGRGPWAKVQLGNGRTGYVSSSLIRSPVDYRAMFEKRGGEWQLTALVSGD